MKNNRSIVTAMCFAASHIWAAQSGPDDLTIAITAPRTCVKRGSPVEVRIVLTNTSGHDAEYRVVAMGQWSGWAAISVHDPDGKLLPEKGAPNDGSVFSGKESLGPSQSVTKIIDIAKDYDLSRPGKYTIEVSPLSGERFTPNRAIVCVRK